MQHELLEGLLTRSGRKIPRRMTARTVILLLYGFLSIAGEITYQEHERAELSNTSRRNVYDGMPRGEFVMDGVETKHVCGIISPDWTRIPGRGSKVQKITTAVFGALFNEDFHEVPAVSVTRIYPWPMYNHPNGDTWDNAPLTWDNAPLIAAGAGRVPLKTGTSAGRKLAERAHGRMR